MRRAQYKGKVGSQRVMRVNVRVEWQSGDMSWDSREFYVLAKSAADAANWARDNMEWPPCTEITAWGPKGGVVRRWIGYESWVWRQWIKPEGHKQLEFTH